MFIGSQQVPTVFYMGITWTNIMQCMQSNFLLTGQMYPMLMSSVPQAGAKMLDFRQITLFRFGYLLLKRKMTI